MALSAAFFGASHAGDALHSSLIPTGCLSHLEGAAPLAVHRRRPGCRQGWAGSASLRALCGEGAQGRETQPSGVSPLLLPLQTTARTRRRCWGPATAARVSAAPRVPALPPCPIASADPNPQLLHPNLSKGNVKPGNARPFFLQLNPTTPAEGGMQVPGHQYATGFYWGEEKVPKRT